MRRAARRFAGRGITSWVAVAALAVMWVGLWGDITWGNVVAGAVLGLVVLWFWPLPTGPRRRFVVRPVALVHLLARFVVDVVIASVRVTRVVLSGRQPVEAVIRVQTRAHSDSFLAATAGFTALVPGSIVIDAHRLTGMLYVHLFDIGTDPEALTRAHHEVLAQEERILRALATDDELMDAGFRPGASARAGRLSPEEFAEHRARMGADHADEEAS